MMVRAEVVLVCAQKGVDSGLVDPGIMPFVLILIIATTLLTPLILKISYRHDKSELPPVDGGFTPPEEVSVMDSFAGTSVDSQPDGTQTSDPATENTAEQNA